MIVYEVTGLHSSGEEWDLPVMFKTLEEAQACVEKEMKAYTYKGTCNWQFFINEREIRI